MLGRLPLPSDTRTGRHPGPKDARPRVPNWTEYSQSRSMISEARKSHFLEDCGPERR